MLKVSVLSCHPGGRSIPPLFPDNEPVTRYHLIRMKNIIRFVPFLLLVPFRADAQLLLSEVAPTNTTQIADADSDHPDWLEIYNASAAHQDLKGMRVSDRQGSGWVLPEYDLAPGERLLIFASGKNRGGGGSMGLDHWETALYEGSLWRTFIGSEAPTPDWASRTFDDSPWSNATGGFGYGDSDDVTEVPAGTLSFYYRRDFPVTDPAKIDSAILSMDYDDGFIAYLNGVEIARSANMPPGTATYTTLTTTDHEAQMYGGGVPDAFLVTKSKLSAVLVPGDNVLAIELHNVDPGSSDLTGRTWLHFGIATSEVFYGPNPSFFTGTGSGSGFYHTDFKIGFGETVRLYDSTGVQLDSVVIPYMLPGHSMMRIGDNGSWCMTNSPTPNAPNGNFCFPGYADKPVVSPDPGFYPGQQMISITGVDIRYTTDGSDPDENSPLYAGPFSVNANTIVRARSFEPGKLPGSTATSTYFIGEVSYLPTLSITARNGDLFNDGSGGLAAYDNYNSGLRAPVHLEYFDKNKQLAFSENASLRPVGGYSVSFDQKSMQFDFDEEYGAVGDVVYPIFEKDKPGITRFREFRVRNMDDDWGSTRMRDVVANRIALPTHCAVTGYQHMNVFINGEYWGHYGGREVLNRFYVRDNHGADPDRVEEIFTSYFLPNPYFPDEGTDAAFFAMSDYIIQNDMTDPAHYAAAQKLVDWENWVDYFATEMYIANGDWFSSMYFNNLRIYRAPDLRWRFLLFDATYSQNNNVSVSTNILQEALADPAVPNRYTDMMVSLLQNPSFKNYFINRFADLLNEYWTPAKTLAIIDENIIEISSEIDRQSQRWGSLSGTDWINAVTYLKNFHRDRPDYQRQQIQDFFSLNNQVEITLQAEPAGAGVIKISTVIPDSYPWTGIYYDGNPVRVTAIPNAGYSFDHWSTSVPLGDLEASFELNFTEDVTLTAHFTGSSKAVMLDISEIQYHPDPTSDSGDWFEIRNDGDYPIDLTGYLVQDRRWYHQYEIGTGAIVAPGQFLVVTEDDARFTALHPGVFNKTGQMEFGLDDDGDQIRLLDREGTSVLSLTYDDSSLWPCTPDGFGRTLERVPGSVDPAVPDSWFDGCVGGSPGVAYAPCEDELVITEINYHSSDAADAGDWFECKNQTGTDISLGGWTIRDEKEEHVFMVPQGTDIPSGGYLVFCENSSQFDARHPGVLNRIGDLGFGLDNGGDIIRLYAPDGTLQFSLCYDDEGSWPTDPDGNGYTLEILDPALNVNDPVNWFAGCPGGSPGVAYDPECASAVDPAPIGIPLNLYPNPAEDFVGVQVPESYSGLIILQDLCGRILREMKMEGQNGSLDLAGLSAGLYVVVGNTNGVMVAKKLVKK